METTWAIIVAAGQSARFGGTLKQFCDLGGKPVLAWSLEKAKSVCDKVAVVIPSQLSNDLLAQIENYRPDLIVEGGHTRAQSVRNALKAVGQDCYEVIVHDAARPLASQELWIRTLSALRGVGAKRDLVPMGAVPTVKLSDTVKQIEDNEVISTIPRDSLVAVQTPQAFIYTALFEAHKGDPNSTDDAELLERIGKPVVTVEGEVSNIKLTYKDDLDLVRAYLLLRQGEKNRES
jgi:2-C-methyl-D-erythritol 4-phosphate cytidylyltransferase